MVDDDGKDLERVALIDVFSEDDVLVSYPAGSSPLGVLDPEELANVNSTFKNAQAYLLPGIQEDTRKSADSNSTLDSDTRVGESAEVDLFENLEASVQRPQRKQDKDPSSHASGTFSSGKMDVADSGGKIDDLANSAFMNERLSSEDRMEAASMSKEHVLSNQPQMVTSENRRKKPSPRATRAASRLPVEPSRRPPSSRSVQPKTREEVLLASSHVGKSHRLNAKEKLISGDLNNATPRVTTSIKVSNSSVKPHASASCNSNSRSGGTSSDRMGKARPDDLRKKTSTKVDPPSSKSVNVCPVRDSKGNCGVRNAKSTMRLSSSISPSSSVDSLASASSSSSTSTVKNPTNSLTTLEPSSYGTLHDSGRVPKGELVNRGSSGIYLWSNLSTVDAARYHISGSEAKEFKPSGLRLPSPKIGYFDTENPRPHIFNRYSLQVTEVSMTPKTSLKDDAGRLNKGLVIPNL